jgi:hypothetical protein
MVLWTPLLFYPFFAPGKSFPKWEWNRWDPPSPLFLRKDIILKGLYVHMAQGCEIKGFTCEMELGACGRAGAEVS